MHQIHSIFKHLNYVANELIYQLDVVKSLLEKAHFLLIYLFS